MSQALPIEISEGPLKEAYLELMEGFSLLESIFPGGQALGRLRLSLKPQGRPDIAARERGLSSLFRLEDGLYWDENLIWDANLRLIPGGLEGDFQILSDFLRVPPTLRQSPAYMAVHGALRVAYAFLAVELGGLLFHGAALEKNGKALLFLGESGAGKSTMIKRLPLWRCLSDDAVILLRRDGTFYVSGSPLAGKERLKRQMKPVLLSGIVFLKKNQELLTLKPLSFGESLFHMSKRVIWFSEPDQRILAHLHALGEALPAFELGSSLQHNPEPLLRELL